MALSDQTRWYIGINDDGALEIRRTRVIMDGAEAVAEKHFRYVLEPGQDVSDQPAKIKQIAQVVWTPQVVTAWRVKRGE